MKRLHPFLASFLFLFGCSANRYFVKDIYQSKAEYVQARERLISAESAFRFDSGIELSPAEEKANRRLLDFKREEIKRTLGHFPPAHNFLKSKHLIDNSPLLEVMRRMPKGGILHAHTSATVDLRWLVSYATYLPCC